MKSFFLVILHQKKALNLVSNFIYGDRFGFIFQCHFTDPVEGKFVWNLCLTMFHNQNLSGISFGLKSSRYIDSIAYYSVVQTF